MTKSLTAAQIANAIHKITPIINSNNGEGIAMRKIVIDDRARSPLLLVLLPSIAILLIHE